jgi:hypothetical protein
MANSFFAGLYSFCIVGFAKALFSVTVPRAFSSICTALTLCAGAKCAYRSVIVRVL